MKGKRGEKPLPPAARALESYRKRVNAVVRATSSLAAFAGELSAGEVRDLAGALREAADALEAQL